MASTLEEELTCSVCTEIFKDPVVLTCTHSFCQVCLRQCWVAKPSRECPICREESSLRDPPLNRSLRNTCEAFLRERAQRGAVCGIHGDRIRLFCHDDQALICFSCRDSRQHRNHHFSPINEAAEDRKEELKVQMAPLEEKLRALKEEKQSCDRFVLHIKTQVQNTERQIKQEFERLHQFLRDEEAARIAALKEEEEQKSQMMKEKIEKMIRDISSLSNTIRDIEEKMATDDVTFLQSYKSTCVGRAQLPLQDPERLSGALINVAKHLGNLKFNIWRKMQDMVQYTPVILDPNTADPILILSDDLTSMRRGDEEQQLPGNPERLDYKDVLGSEGFNSGTHCWDVDVAENYMYSVGVKTKSDSWFVGFYDCEYMAAGPDFLEYYLATVEKQLKKIRVHLDLDRGKLSFYDPDDNKHIISFTQAFTGRVYPYFRSLVAPLCVLPMKVSVRGEQPS